MKFTLAAVLAGVMVLAGQAFAGSPQMKTPAPVIYLADNLDEQDNLGWCIDTQGRGFSERLHAHSCKPRGGDVQFKFEESSGKIMSAEFANKCATLLAPAKAGVQFGLLDCKAGAANQSFGFNADKGEFFPKGNSGLCLTVGAGSRSAGPFMSRDLALADCAATEAKFKKWIVKK